MTNYDSNEEAKQKGKQDDSQALDFDVVDTQEEFAEEVKSPRPPFVALGLTVLVVGVLVIAIISFANGYTESQNATATVAAQVTATALEVQAARTGTAEIIASQTSLAAFASPTTTSTPTQTSSPSPTPTITASPTTTPTPPSRQAWGRGTTTQVVEGGLILRQQPDEDAPMVEVGGRQPFSYLLTVTSEPVSGERYQLNSEENQWWWYVENELGEGWARQRDLRQWFAPQEEEEMQSAA